MPPPFYASAATMMTPLMSNDARTVPQQHVNGRGVPNRWGPPMSGYASAEPTSDKNDGRYKTIMCKRWELTGSCRFGDK